MGDCSLICHSALSPETGGCACVMSSDDDLFLTAILNESVTAEW